jgi:hypothetical protein
MIQGNATWRYMEFFDMDHYSWQIKVSFLSLTTIFIVYDPIFAVRMTERGQ